MEKIPYARHCIDEDDINAVVGALKSGYLTQGPGVDEFEEIVANFHGVRYAVAFTNGTAALHGAYFASGIGEGGQFITSAITFVASANAGLYLGATPVLCDITMKDYNISLERLPTLINEKTKVITPVSYAGNPVSLGQLYAYAKERGITIIHDAAHAIGARIEDRGICDDADMAMISLHPAKHVATGEGGIILTNNDNYYRKLKLFRTHGITKLPAEMSLYDGAWYYEMQELGYNYRLPDILCALGISQMKKIKENLRRRNEIANIYDKELSGLDFLTLPVNNFDRSFINDRAYAVPKDLHSYHLYPVLTESRLHKQLFDYLRGKGIMVQVHYIPVHFMPYYQKKHGFNRGDFPVAEEFYAREISLPMFHGLTELQQEYVIDVIRKFM